MMTRLGGRLVHSPPGLDASTSRNRQRQNRLRLGAHLFRYTRGRPLSLACPAEPSKLRVFSVGGECGLPYIGGCGSEERHTLGRATRRLARRMNDVLSEGCGCRSSRSQGLLVGRPSAPRCGWCPSRCRAIRRICRCCAARGRSVGQAHAASRTVWLPDSSARTRRMAARTPRPAPSSAASRARH
jgi:hypothetical protein